MTILLQLVHYNLIAIISEPCLYGGSCNNEVFTLEGNDHAGGVSSVCCFGRCYFRSVSQGGVA
ncbi:MAG TPA: hypothetical protein VG722_00465, partial [Tepidisphaeraceae bacterium]|nr:hypothetical protein [Tepidisphaeraceae bacterium]